MRSAMAPAKGFAMQIRAPSREVFAPRGDFREGLPAAMRQGNDLESRSRNAKGAHAAPTASHGVSSQPQ